MQKPFEQHRRSDLRAIKKFMMMSKVKIVSATASRAANTTPILSCTSKTHTLRPSALLKPIWYGTENATYISSKKRRQSQNLRNCTPRWMERCLPHVGGAPHGSSGYLQNHRRQLRVSAEMGGQG